VVKPFPIARIRVRLAAVRKGEVIMKRRLWIAAAAAVLAAAVAVPLVAAAASSDTKFQIGFSLQFTGPDSTAGVFVASGAVKDSGTSVATNLVVVPTGHRDEGQLSGNQSFIGHAGTIETTFTGIARDISQPNQSAKGTFEIVGGTGSYAGLRGHGTFLVVVNVATNQVIGTAEAKTS
jgi:hypothetical protein